MIAAYIGLLPHSTSPSIPQQYQPNDKFLHLLTFFLLSLIFYWIFETSRRRALQLTLLVCTLTLGVGSEILQGFLPNDRPFDPLDLVANLVGSLAAVGLNGWYHRRMLERRRNARYGSGGAGPYADGENPEDVELGLAGHGHDGEEGDERGLGPQETGVMSLEQEVDNWDENAVDTWDTEDGVDEAGPQEGQKPGTTHEGAVPTGEGKKRSD